MRPTVPLWVYGAALLFAAVLSVCSGCTMAPPQTIYLQPQVIIQRFTLVPEGTPEVDDCGEVSNCWYEKPTDFGPI